MHKLFFARTAALLTVAGAAVSFSPANAQRSGGQHKQTNTAAASQREAPFIKILSDGEKPLDGNHRDKWLASYKAIQVRAILYSEVKTGGRTDFKSYCFVTASKGGGGTITYQTFQITLSGSEAKYAVADKVLKDIPVSQAAADIFYKFSKRYEFKDDDKNDTKESLWVRYMADKDLTSFSDPNTGNPNVAVMKTFGFNNGEDLKAISAEIGKMLPADIIKKLSQKGPLKRQVPDIKSNANP